MILRDKVAKAMFDVNGEVWQLQEADAAIAAVMEALEEPSEGMTWEGAEISSYAVEQQRTRPISRFGEYGAHSIWQAMLRQFKVEQGI